MANRAALTDIHAKADPAVHIIRPDGSGEGVEEDREHPPQELRLTGHLSRTAGVRNGRGVFFCSFVFLKGMHYLHNLQRTF